MRCCFTVIDGECLQRGPSPSRPTPHRDQHAREYASQTMCGCSLALGLLVLCCLTVPGATKLPMLPERPGVGTKNACTKDRVFLVEYLMSHNLGNLSRVVNVYSGDCQKAESQTCAMVTVEARGWRQRWVRLMASMKCVFLQTRLSLISISRRWRQDLEAAQLHRLRM